MTKKNGKNEDIIINGVDLLNELGLEDFAGPDDSELWADKYPAIQWHNREKKWEFPLKSWAGTAIEANNKLVEVDHVENVEHGFLLDMIHVSVIAWRYTWERQGEDGRMVYAARPDFDGGQKWSKRYHFLVLCKETESTDPALITARGYTGEYLYNALEQGRNRMLKIVQRETGKRLQAGYLFWVPLIAGEKRMAGKEKKSPIYPPAPLAYELAEDDHEGWANIIKSLYIGPELKELYTSYLYDEGKQWAIETPKQLALSAGEPEARALILPGGILHIPDFSEDPPMWVKSVRDLVLDDGTPLFDSPQHCNNALRKLLRERGLTLAALADQFEAWREEVQRRIDDKAAKVEAESRQLELTG